MRLNVDRDYNIFLWSMASMNFCYFFMMDGMLVGQIDFAGQQVSGRQEEDGIDGRGTRVAHQH